MLFIYNVYKHVYKHEYKCVCMLNKCKISILAVTNQVNFARPLHWSILKYLAKLLAGYMLNKEL